MKHPQDNKTVDLVDAGAAPSTRGRKPMAAAEVVDVQIDDAALQRDNQAATALAVHQSLIAGVYGDNAPYQRERVVHEAQFFISQSGEAMLQAGKRLIELKENESHGDFLAIVETQLGLGKRAAQAMMQAAAKYLSPRLAGKAQTSALLGRSKMLELVTEPDEDLEQFFDGGTLAGHTFEEVDAMSVRELRAALRDHKQQLDAKDKVIAERSAKVDKLEERLHKPFKPGKGSEWKTKEEHDDINELREAMTAAELAFMRLSLVVSTITERSESEAVNKAAGDALGYLIARIRDNVNNNQLMLDTSDEAFGLAPSWK